MSMFSRERWEVNHHDPRSSFASEPVTDLADARVTMIGTGSVGSLAAWCVAGCGVGHLNLIDRETLAPENVCRHVGCHRQLGRAKSDVVAEFLLDRFGTLNITHQQFCVRSDPERFLALLGRTDLAVVAIDDEGAKYLIDSMLWEHGLPAVYLGVYGGGWGAEAILVDPTGDTRCYGCAAEALGRVGVSSQLDTADPSYALPSSSLPSAEWRRATLSNLMPIAALGADIARARLEAARGQSRRWNEMRSSAATAWRVASRRISAWHIEPWQVVPVIVERSVDCPVCGPPFDKRAAKAEFARLLGPTEE
jgi:molybdopterin/thiamine biosynthesis adenylyltransferase